MGPGIANAPQLSWINYENVSEWFTVIVVSVCRRLRRRRGRVATGIAAQPEELNKLLKNELSAVEAYQQALKKEPQASAKDGIVLCPLAHVRGAYPRFL